MRNFPVCFVVSVLFAAILASFVSCASGPEDIPEDATPDKLIQWGQAAVDQKNYESALQYYQAVLDRYSIDGPYSLYMEYVCAAEYEIAFIHYKEKKYSLSQQELNALLARYSDEEIPRELLPLEYETLANIVLQKIADKETHEK